MRRLADEQTIVDFMGEFGRSARQRVRVYLTGGASAVLLGWRTSTLDVDLRFIPDEDALYRAIPALKERLHLNVEIAAPSDFIPELPGWEERSRFITQVGKADFYHYDFYAQALAKIERGHVQDVHDVTSMLEHGLVEPAELLHLFACIEPRLYRYPAIDPPRFRAAVEAVAGNPPPA